MGTFRMPEVLFLVLAKDFSFIGNEICDVGQYVTVFFDNRARDDVDVQFFGERAVGIEVLFILSAERDEFGVIGKPIGEVIFGEDCKVAGL
jgi:hypothetical protein